MRNRDHQVFRRNIMPMSVERLRGDEPRQRRAIYESINKSIKVSRDFARFIKEENRDGEPRKKYQSFPARKM
jgi:hypothetical protein